MKIILDTHIFLWALADPARIEKRKRDEIESPVNSVFVSSISIAELVIKASVGKIKVDFDPVAMIEACGFEALDFTRGDAVLLKSLPFHHRDPFDRMLITQCLSRNFYILTDDEKFRFYDCKVL